MTRLLPVGNALSHTHPSIRTLFPNGRSAVVSASIDAIPYRTLKLQGHLAILAMAHALFTGASQAWYPLTPYGPFLETTFTELMGNRIDLTSDTVVFKRSLPLASDRRSPQAHKNHFFNHLL